MQIMVERSDGGRRIVVQAEVQEPEVASRLAKLLAVVDGALGGGPAPNGVPTSPRPAPVAAAAPVGAGAPPGNGNGSDGISAKQRSFMLGLASKSGLKVADVNKLAREITGRADAAIGTLSKVEASQVIETLKARSEEAA